MLASIPRKELVQGAAKVFGKLKSFNRKPQACALGMDESLSAVIANTHACGLRLNDLSDRQGKLPHPMLNWIAERLVTVRSAHPTAIRFHRASRWLSEVEQLDPVRDADQIPGDQLAISGQAKRRKQRGQLRRRTTFVSGGR